MIQDYEASVGAQEMCRRYGISDAKQYPERGRLGILLARKGFEVNQKKLFWLYREEGLVVRRRRSRKRVLATRRSNLWFRIAIIRDGHWTSFPTLLKSAKGPGCGDCTREALATVVDRSLSGVRLTRELGELIRRRSQPEMIVSELPMRCATGSSNHWRWNGDDLAPCSEVASGHR